MHPHDAHLSGSDVRPEQYLRWSVVRAVRSPSLRASERQSHSAEGDREGGNRYDGGDNTDGCCVCLHSHIHVASHK